MNLSRFFLLWNNGNLIEVDLESRYTCGLKYVKENKEFIFANRNRLIGLHHILVKN